MATKAIDAPRKTTSGLKTNSRRIRKIFGNIHEISEMPNLIEVQRESYEQFLRSDPKTGYVSGLEKTLRSVFPIMDFAGTAHLDFDHYELEHPKYDTDECRQRGLTYAAPMRVTLRLTTFEIDPETEAKSVIDIKEQDVYMGDMPLMTMNGTFIINGTERVIVSQMHRSPGVLFDHDRGKTHASGKYLFAARVIPYRGSWLDFEFDAKDIVNVRIDRKRKLPVTALLHALGMTSEEILNTFYDRVIYTRGKNGWQIPYSAEAWRGQKPNHEVVDADTGEIIFKANEKITPRRANQAGKDGVKNLIIPTEEIFGRYSAYDLINEKTGEIYIEAGDEVSEENLAKLDAAGVKTLELLDIDFVNTGPWIRNTLKADKSEDGDSALADIYRVMRPGEPPTRETADALFYGLFFDPERYDLSAVGRVKLNMRLGLDAEDTVTTLRKEDILAVVQELVNLKDGKGDIDDIDNLANRRVRSVGELLENQYRVGLLRMERAVKERMSSVDVSTVMPNDLINAKPAVAAVREFFGSSQLSQFMDQTNPLSEVTHKRRVSALGPGGLTRERAGFEVRDVHPDALWPYLPDRDAGRAEHRPHQLARQLQPREQVRLHRDSVPQGHRRQGDHRGRLFVRDGRGEAHDRPGERRDHQGKYVCRGHHLGPPQRRVPDRAARPDHADGRVAEAARFGRRIADSLPRERRREPGAHGIEHAAPGSAAAPSRSAAGRYRHGGDSGARFGRSDRGSPIGHRRPGRRSSYRRSRDRRPASR